MGAVQVCIETSAIVACMLAAMTNADVILFAHDVLRLPPPKSISEALDMALSVEVRGATNPALSIKAIHDAGTVYGSVLVITDEDENGTADMTRDGVVVAANAYFAQAFQEYERSVAPGVKPTFISFLANPNHPGWMTPRLEEAGYTVPTFTLQQGRPDLRRLDGIFATMAASGAAFDARVNAAAAAAEAKAKEEQGAEWIVVDGVESLSVTDGAASL